MPFLVTEAAYGVLLFIVLMVLLAPVASVAAALFLLQWAFERTMPTLVTIVAHTGKLDEGYLPPHRHYPLHHPWLATACP
jgi:hypothetical protein